MVRLGYLAPIGLLASAVVAQATNNTTRSAPAATTSQTLIQQAYDLPDALPAYNPSKAPAGIFGALYGIATFIIFFRLFASRARWGLCLPIGTAVMMARFWTRIAMTIYPNSMALFLCSALFILLSPAAFLALNYILYGRFIVTCVHRSHPLIRPERTARKFVISDYSTFLIQGTRGLMLTSTDPNTDKIGVYVVVVVVVGLALQTLSFGFYMFLVYHAYSSLKRHGIKPSGEPWGMVLKMCCNYATEEAVRRINAERKIFQKGIRYCPAPRQGVAHRGDDQNISCATSAHGNLREHLSDTGI
ncbi:hypothetical protein BS17DRAFT_769922 [Gyrodon lividus]|nr:hypothetical protein BS17DRAFT_769922 [Gyrodon lividus]